MRAAILIVALATTAHAQPRPEYRQNVNKLTAEKKAECAAGGGCYVLTDAQLMVFLKRAHLAGRRTEQYRMEREPDGPKPSR